MLDDLRKQGSLTRVYLREQILRDEVPSQRLVEVGLQKQKKQPTMSIMNRVTVKLSRAILTLKAFRKALR